MVVFVGANESPLDNTETWLGNGGITCHSGLAPGVSAWSSALLSSCSVVCFGFQF